MLFCLLLGAATLAAYWPVLDNGFIQLDDAQYVTENPHVLTGLKWENMKWAFQAGYASNWHPLTWLSHMVDVQLFGLKPGWHHLVNLLWHIANTVLLFLVLRRMTGAEWRSAFVAALFALHPLHVESVAWVAERKDVLSTFFFMLTLGAYARYAEVRSVKREARGQQPGVPSPDSELSQPSTLEPRPSNLVQPSSIFHPPSSFYVLALVFFALGLMSKPMLVTLPFVLLLLDYWPLERFQSGKEKAGSESCLGLLREKAPFFVLAAASCVVTFLVQDRGRSVSTDEGLPLEPRLVNTIASYVKYLGKTFWPVDLTIFYPHSSLGGPAYAQTEAEMVASALLLLAISAGAVLRLKRQPWLATGWFWYLGTLVPVIGIVQVGGAAMADRYTYIPLIGVFVCFAWGAADFLGGWCRTRTVVAVASVLVLLGCGAVTRHQLTYWRDGMAVFDHALAVTANNAPAHYIIGARLAEQGHYDQAAAHFRAAVEALPAYADAYYGLASVLALQGQTEEAVRNYQTALRINPSKALFHNGLGVVLWRLGRYEEALEEYQEAVRLNPALAQAQCNLGTALSVAGKLEDAATHFAAAIQLAPDYVAAVVGLGRTLALQGRLPEAATRFEEAVRLCPTNAEVRLNLGEVRWKLGQHELALQQYSESLHLQRDQPLVHYMLATALLEQGKLAEAATHFAEAARLQPNSASALTGLGRALALQGKSDQALAQFREVARLCPTNAEAHVALGNALLAAGQTNEATPAFADARRLDPGLASKYLQTGKTLAEEGQVDAALASLFTAVHVDPDDAGAHEDLGLLMARQGKLEDAVSQFEEVLRLRPDAQSWYNLGLAHTAQGRAKEAVTNYQHALRLRPDWPDALNNLAWLLATDAEAEVRNGAEAVRLAERACQVSGGKEARFWGTLDAAYAEAGRFAEAVSTAEKARDLALAAGEKDLAQAAEQRLAVYRKQQPYRQ